MTGTHIAFSHDAHCPEISPRVCADPDIEMLPHEHHQGVTMLRYQTTASVGLGGGWQVMGMIPVDAKLISIEYTTMDGEPYDPPYGDIHHRNETLFGLGDGRIEAQYFFRVADGWVLGGGLGATVPLGRTEENPYALAERSEKHQHMQMGSGTVDPAFSLSSAWTGAKWGGDAHVQREHARGGESPWLQAHARPPVQRRSDLHHQPELHHDSRSQPRARVAGRVGR